MAYSQKKNIVRLVFYLLLTITVMTTVIYGSVSIVVQTVYPKDYADIIESTAEEFNIDKPLLYALVKTESGFDKEAVSEVGARGLTQITPETFEWLQTKTGESYTYDALDEPEISVYYGAYFLSMLIEEFGNTETALAAYHAGRGIVNQWLNDPRYSDDGETVERIPYKDTAAYVKKVMKNCEIYRSIYDF